MARFKRNKNHSGKERYEIRDKFRKVADALEENDQLHSLLVIICIGAIGVAIIAIGIGIMQIFENDNVAIAVIGLGIAVLSIALSIFLRSVVFDKFRFW